MMTEAQEFAKRLECHAEIPHRREGLDKEQSEQDGGKGMNCAVGVQQPAEA